MAIAIRPVRHGSRRLTLAVLAAGAGVFSMLQSLITPVLPTIQQDLHTSRNTVTWVFTAYLLSASICTPILGRIGDIRGKERMLVVSLATLAVGCLLAAVAPSIGLLIAARIVQGVGGAVFPLSFGIIRDEFPAARVSSAVGTLSAIVAAGSGLGIVAAGPIVGALDYRWLFWIPMVVVGLTAVAAHLLVPASPVRTPGRINWASTALLSGWLVALLLPISQATVWGWGSVRVVALLALAVALFAGWLVAEMRSANPLIDMRMMRLPAVWTTNLAALLFGAAMFAVYAFVPQFVQIPASAGYGFGAGVTGAGLLMLPMLVAMFLAGIVGGRLEARFSAKVQLTTGAALGALACAALAGLHDRPWQVAVAAGLFGLGIGLSFAAMPNLIVRAVPAAQTGAATGMNANIRTIGGAIGGAAVSAVITAHPQASGLPREAGFTLGFVVVTVLAAAATAAAAAVPSRPRSPQPPIPTDARPPALIPVGAAR
ncbi:MFS transporter [Micromonospora mirobrigensis]|uniref:Predicted arabinose efflux permease, MFS family n=1 Tax=Micromonospora mirobrigensis TaxID=262898 RepID=A0A1C5AA46_9ACTN|nr:MFS transporter [Micromonospora mirobrigensis]SCF42019.1 Predicted arabinose efflux permease, MFS family [Micromonospora mirobrigensis]